MSLNKEMIFGLAFDGDNMKMLVLTSYEIQYYRGTMASTSFVTSTPICITGLNDIGDYQNDTITYPDGSTLLLSGRYASTDTDSLPTKIYVPEGTKLDIISGSYLYYLPCKWVDV
jgi:hypothetical protein